MVHKIKESSQIHMRLSPWMYNQLDVLSERLGMTISDCIRMAINDLIKKECTANERNVSFIESNVSKPSGHQKANIEKCINDMLIEQFINDQLDDSQKMIEEQIKILYEKMIDFRKSGDIHNAKEIDKKIQRLRKLVDVLKTTSPGEKSESNRGVLKIANNNLLQ